MRDIDKKLFTAVRENKPIKVIQKLLDAGADPLITNKFGETLFFFVQSTEVAEFLASYADLPVDTHDCFGRTPLHKVSNAEMTKFFLKHLFISIKDIHGRTPLHVAEDAKIAKLLLSAASQADNTKLYAPIYLTANDADNYGNTPLHFTDDPQIAKLLIKHHADINAKNKLQRTPLHFAARSNNLNIVKFLIKHGANINASDTYNNTPLLLAIDSYNYKNANLLINHGANVNISNKKTSPLISLVYHQSCLGHDNIKTIKLLIKHGANINAKNQMGHTALYYAKKYNNTNLIKYLESVGAK